MPSAKKLSVSLLRIKLANWVFLYAEKYASVKTARELELEDVLSSARAIARRDGMNTHWRRFDNRIGQLGVSPITPRTFKILPSDGDIE